MQPKANPLCPLCGEPNDCAPVRSGSFVHSASVVVNRQRPS